MLRRAKVLVIGSSNTDMVVHAPKIPEPGETVLGGDILLAAGGKGANQAVAASRLGADVTLVARIGTDIFGDRAFSNIASSGVITKYVVRDSATPSGVALICVDPVGQNSIVVAPGANANLSVTDVEAARVAFEMCDIVVLQLEVPIETVSAAVEMAHRLGKRVVLNPAPAQALDWALLSKVHILTPNQSEAALLLGVPRICPDEAGQAAEQLRGIGPEAVVLTLGEQGAAVAHVDGTMIVPGRPTIAIDSTAAGDCFNGALVTALGEGMPLEDAVAFANCAASLSITRSGAQASMPSRGEVEELMRVGRAQ